MFGSRAHRFVRVETQARNARSICFRCDRFRPMRAHRARAAALRTPRHALRAGRARPGADRSPVMPDDTSATMSIGARSSVRPERSQFIHIPPVSRARRPGSVRTHARWYVPEAFWRLSAHAV